MCLKNAPDKNPKLKVSDFITQAFGEIFSYNPSGSAFLIFCSSNQISLPQILIFFLRINCRESLESSQKCDGCCVRHLG